MSAGREALPPILRLIDLLAQQAVEDYLTGKVGPDAAPVADRPNPAPLPDLDRAA